MQSFLAVIVIISLSVVPSSFVVLLIDERNSGSKHLQTLAGVPPWLYWMTNFIWDLFSYTFTVILVVIVFLIFGDDCFTKEEALAALISLLMVFGWAVIPMMYLCSFLFDLGSSAYVILTSFNLLLGMMTTITTLILQSLGQVEASINVLNNILTKIFFVL